MTSRKRVNLIKKRQKLYTEDWDAIRRKVYARDGHRCVLCFKKGKVHAHHIIPVAISHDNSLGNLVTACAKCHRKLEAIGYKILAAGGHRTDVRRVELKMIVEARQKYLKRIQEQEAIKRAIEEQKAPQEKKVDGIGTIETAIQTLGAGQQETQGTEQKAG
jgi:hypothetical protein